MKAIALQLPSDIVLNVYRLKYQNHDTDLLDLSHVCHIWRDALHKFPDFWANVDIHLGKRNPDQKADYWVKRAGQKPLVISILSRGPQPGPPAATSQPDAILVRLGLVLRGCMDRWDSFTMHTSLQAIERLLPICTGYTPRLRIFSLDCWWHSSRNARRLLMPLLPPVEPPSDSSRLSVSIHNCIPRFTMFGAGITRLSVDFSVDSDNDLFHMDDLIGLFQSCPNLIDFDFSALSSEYAEPLATHESILLRRLATLSISWIWNIADILDLLQLPSLESITLYQVDWSHASKAALWNIFRSSHSLSSVIIGQDGDDCYERDPNPLHQTPLTLNNVTTLYMQGRHLSTLLDLLTLPNLEELDLSDATISTAHRLISLSPKLHDLSLCNLDPVFADFELDPAPIPILIPDPTLAPIFLPALTSLQISSFPAFVNYIHAPHLSTLKLGSRYGNYPRVVNSREFLRPAIERAAPALRVLHLRGLDAGDKDVQWCLERLSVLEELNVSSCAISDSVLSALASELPPSPGGPGQNSGWLLPRLKKFGFDGNDGVTPGGAIQFLASRTLNPTPDIAGEFGFKGMPLSRDDATTIMSYGPFLSMPHVVVFHMNLEDNGEV
ncbi:hypothetical protein BOTBODRAFT_39552 [Botryobasidium botryosum FD-172 SS1]|uniref:F-box domain-containing protein n=1 Tax=Botryobasidium botryosum (strain FD-172 SS1) TaxID=930990 RepID=A0A067M3Q7_BOTB1|nr:hypothetical protein BOTBODRAFT_39552 [Botryobasidium botryosum FD-172 SS1]